MDELLTAIAAKKKRLDGLRPLSPEALAHIEHVHDIELTYTSNAIEGNSLTEQETAMVIEQGVVIAGKPLNHHLEALDHFDAMRYVREMARGGGRLGEREVCNLHSVVLHRSRPDIAGHYADLPRHVRTENGAHAFPLPSEIPALMGYFAALLQTECNTPDEAFAAHQRLLNIHPFNDGNGRVARLLMNLILLRGGYPPVALLPESRSAYIRTLEREQAGAGADSFNQLFYQRLDSTLDEYLASVDQYIKAPR